MASDEERTNNINAAYKNACRGGVDVPEADIIKRTLKSSTSGDGSSSETSLTQFDGAGRQPRYCFRCSFVGIGFVKALLRITPLQNYAQAGKMFMSGSCPKLSVLYI